MQTHLEANDPLASSFREQFFPGRELLTLPIADKMPRTQCYANVVDTIAARGGSMELAWLLTLWPGRFVEAMHHALWRDSDGNLFDVTAEAYAGMANKSSTVILDPSMQAPSDYWGLSVPPIFMLLDRSPANVKFTEAVADHIKAKSALMTLMRNEGAICRRDKDGFVQVGLFQKPSKRLVAAQKDERFAEARRIQLQANLQAEDDR